MKSYLIALIATCGLLFFVAGFFPALIALAGIGVTSAITWDRTADGKHKQLR